MRKKHKRKTNYKKGYSNIYAEGFQKRFDKTKELKGGLKNNGN